MREQNYKMGPILVHWVNFGPYHVARLNAAHEYFSSKGRKVFGLEIANQQKKYEWEKQEGSRQFSNISLFNVPYEEIKLSGLWFRINQVLGEIDPEIIFIAGYSSKDALLIKLWSMLHKIPTILMSDSKMDDRNRPFYRELPKKIIVKLFSAALCAGSPQKDYLLDLGMEKDSIFLGYDVVDNDHFKPRKKIEEPGIEKRPYFLVSSRFIQRKNLKRLLLAYQKYKTRIFERGHDPWKLIILGDGEQRQELEDFISKNDLTSDIELPGFVGYSELVPYYQNAKVFIHPAIQDQWGLVVNEAMAAGLPVIVSNTTGCCYDLIEEGINGFLIDPFSIEDICEKMCMFTTGELNLEEMGKSSKEIIANWDLARFVQGMDDALQVTLPNCQF